MYRYVSISEKAAASFFRAQEIREESAWPPHPFNPNKLYYEPTASIFDKV
jgi:hypothetical protein